jgi:hypothetical protein
MPTHPEPTDPGREAALGRIALWLDPEDLTWLGSHCACTADTPMEERERCGRIRFRANAALHKAGQKDT